MPASHYRLSAALAASLSLALGGCSGHKSDSAAAAGTPAAANPAATAPAAAIVNPAAKLDQGMDTEATLWTMIGLAKKPSQLQSETTGPDVSPVLWEAAQDSLKFAKIESLDPMTGLIVTDWYTPQNKPDERLRVTAFVKSRALRSDSLAVTIERQQRTASGQWQDATIARQAVEALENDILLRARHIHAERLRAQHSS